MGAGKPNPPMESSNPPASARLDNGRFVSFAIPSGERKFQSSMKHDPLVMTVRPDKALYLEMVLLPGNWRGGGRFIPTSEKEAKARIKKLKPLDAKWIVAPEMLWNESTGPPGPKKVIPVQV